MLRRNLAHLGARILMAAGLGAGLLGILIWNFGFRVRVPDWMWRVAAVKLTFAAAAGLIIAGALLLRRVKKAERVGERVLHPSPNEAPRKLRSAPPSVAWGDRDPEPQRITTPPDTPAR